MPWPAPDWTPVHPFPFAAARKAFAGPTSDEGRIVMRYFRRPDGTLAAVAEFGPRAEGAPGQVHGGMILTVLDEALGAAVWVAGHPVLTVRLETEFRKSVPIRSRLLVETEVVRVRHRLVAARGVLLGADGTRYASASGDFMRLSEPQQRALFGRAL